MRDAPAEIRIKRMVKLNDWLLHGAILFAGGIFFLVGGIYSVCKGQCGLNLVGIVIGSFLTWSGGSNCLFFLQNIFVSTENIRLMLGPLVLRSYSKKQIQSIFCAALWINRGAQTHSVIVLSTQTGDVLRRWTDLNDYLNKKTLCAGYLPARYGLWLESGQERMDALRQILPEAELISK